MFGFGKKSDTFESIVAPLSEIVAKLKEHVISKNESRQKNLEEAERFTKLAEEDKIEATAAESTAAKIEALLA